MGVSFYVWHYIKAPFDNKIIPSFWDQLAYFYCGIPPFTPSRQESFEMPIAYLITNLVLLFALGNTTVSVFEPYEEFQKIVQEITEFEAPKGERHAQLQRVIDTAIEVRQKILRGESIGAIRAATVPTEEALRSSGDIELKEKFDAWNGKFNEKSEDESYKIKDVAELAKDDALKEMEDKLVQECHYLMLCEDVRLQEEFIQKRIERYWDGQRLTRLLKRMLNYRAFAVLSGSVLIAMSFLGIISLDEAMPTLQKLGFVIAPVIVDVVVNLFGVHKPDQKG